MTVLDDMKHAGRALRKAPGFTLAAVATLGLGMALSTTAFGVLNAYVLQGLPYPGAERLYSVRYGPPGRELPRNMETLDWQTLSDVIEHEVAWDLDVFYLLGGEQAEAAPGAWVTEGFVQGLGVSPAIGAGFDAEAFAPGGSNAALISHRLWTTRFGADPQIAGRTFKAYVSDRPAEAETFRIAGVLPERFWHINAYTDVIVPLRAPSYPYMVKLRPGVRPEDAASRISSLVRAGAADVPADWRAELTSSHAAYVAEVRPVLRAVTAAAILVFLVGCANVAGLMLVRAARRRKELAVRAALGAGRWTIARMLFAETLVLAIGSTLLALYLSDLALDALAPLVEQQLRRRAPGARTFALGWETVGAAGLLSVAAAIALTLASIPGLLRPSLAGEAQSVGRAATAGRRAARLRSVLIAIEIAASLTLLVGTTLMLRTVDGLLRVAWGFDGDRVMYSSTTLRQSRYPDAASREAVFDRLLARLEALPGAESAAITAVWPVQQPRLEPVSAAGRDGDVSARAGVHAVTGRYFEVLGMTLAAGRAFDVTDGGGSEPVAIVSRSLAGQLWPGGHALGRLVSVPQDAPDARRLARRVVGIAGDVRQGARDTNLADLYVPLAQAPGRFGFVMIRAAGGPTDWIAPLRAVFRDVDPEIALSAVTPLRERMSDSLARPRFLAALLGSFAATAAVLALVGVYGVIAYAVRQREREIAVRIAVGADPGRLTRLFVREGGIVLLVGLLLGAAGALAAGRLVESQLYGVPPYDPVALAGAAAAFGGAGLLAVWWPSRRAALTDPAVALRSE